MDVGGLHPRAEVEAPFPADFRASTYMNTGVGPRSVPEELFANKYVAVKECKHGVMMYNKNDLFVGRSLSYYGEWCENDLQLLNQLVSPGDVVLDVGSNLGAYTVPLAKMVGDKNGAVYAFEPQRLIFQMLCANVALNALMKVMCFPFALSNAQSTIKVPGIDPNSSSNFGCLNIEGHSCGDGVQVTTIDSFQFSRCNLIKIDVEGMEQKVLAGAQQTIEQFRPFIYVENGDEEKSHELIELLHGFDYRCWWHINTFYNPANYFGRDTDIFSAYGPEANMICFHKDSSMDLVGRLLPVLGPGDTRLKALERSEGKRYFIHSSPVKAQMVELKKEPGDHHFDPRGLGSKCKSGPGAGRARENRPPKTEAGVQANGSDQPIYEKLFQAIMTRQSGLAMAHLHFQSGRLDEAESIFRNVGPDNPYHAEACLGLAKIALCRERKEDAVRMLFKVLKSTPDSFEALHLVGLSRKRQGRLREAAVYFQRALKIEPERVEAICDLGITLIEQKKAKEGVDLCRRGLLAHPNNPRLIRCLAQALFESGKLAEAESAVRRSIELEPGQAAAFGLLANILSETGQSDEAVRMLRHAVHLDPDNRVLRDRFRGNIQRIVPTWHFEMLNDNHRNKAYEGAISRSIKPGGTLLEIGTGSGLLAMIAAKAGAERVYTCEMVKTIAAKASSIIGQNGLSDLIEVVSKKSQDMRVGTDMSRKADLLLMEIFSSELLAENLLPTIEDAKARLLVQDARIIPAQASLRGVLVGGEQLESCVRVGRVSGFDLSLFNEFTPPKYVVESKDLACDRQSDDFRIFEFDLQGLSRFPEEQKTIEVPITKSGRAMGVLQWISLRLDKECVYENHPFNNVRGSHWQHILYTFPEPINIEKGQTILLNAEHNRVNVNVSIDRVMGVRKTGEGRVMKAA